MRPILFSAILLFSCFSHAGKARILKVAGLNAAVIRSVLDEVIASRGRATTRSMEKVSIQQLSCNLGNDSRSKQVSCIALIDFQSRGVLIGDAESVRLVRAIPLIVHEQYIKTGDSSEYVIEIGNVSCKKINMKDLCTYSAIIGE